MPRQSAPSASPRPGMSSFPLRPSSLLRQGRSGWADPLMHRVVQGMAIALLLLLAAIVAELLIPALPAIRTFGLRFLFTTEWNPVTQVYGIAPQIYGTLVTSLVAVAIVVPLSLGIAILLVEDLLPRAVRVPLSFLIELLAAIPSVVYGLWGIFILIPTLMPLFETLHQNLGWLPFFSTPPSHRALLPTILVLALMILPIMVALSRDALLALPDDLRQAAAAVGATRWETIVHILLPASLSGIVGATVLALGRAMGETMAAVMLIGNANQINLSWLAPSSTIAALVANQFPEARDLQISALLYAALVLMGLTLVINVSATGWINAVGRSQKPTQSTPTSPTSPPHSEPISPPASQETNQDNSNAKARPISTPLSASPKVWNSQRLSRSGMSWLLTAGCGLALAIALLAIASIFVSLITQGSARLDSMAITQLPPPPLATGGGFRNAITGTLLMVGIATGISATLGIGVAIYLVEFSRDNRLSRWVRFGNGVLSGVPSILCGLFAYSLVVLTTGTFSAVAGGIALAVVMLPITVRTVEEGLRAVTTDLREGAIALGATTSQTIFGVVLPTAAPGIITGVILAMARAIGETAPLLFTALFSQYGINGLWNPIASLSVLIYNFALSPYPNYQALAWTAALVLVGLILVVSVGARSLTRILNR
ncbi:MAG: phosphate ABC transporter permease PstA [Cyanobacteria bacterium J06638_22]